MSLGVVYPVEGFLLFCYYSLYNILALQRNQKLIVFASSCLLLSNVCVALNLLFNGLSTSASLNERNERNKSNCWHFKNLWKIVDLKKIEDAFDAMWQNVWSFRNVSTIHKTFR